MFHWSKMDLKRVVHLKLQKKSFKKSKITICFFLLNHTTKLNVLNFININFCSCKVFHPFFYIVSFCPCRPHVGHQDVVLENITIHLNEDD